MLNVAHEWGYLAVVPKFRKIKLPATLPRPMRPEHFELIYKKCEVATMPAGVPYKAGIFAFRPMMSWSVRLRIC